LANEPYYIKSFDTDLDIKPMPPSVRTDKIINPAAPQPVKPTSSFPNLHKANVTNMINAKPKNKNIEAGKNNPKKVNDNMIKA
tara:strand:+ start:624 stop:872 length:249 start_codon:yes stop_codon:yes gene_type:complete